MKVNNLLTVKNRYEFREWLQENHEREKECWIFVKRGRPSDDETFWYLDAVEEALCFGWIDSTNKIIEGQGRAQRFSPRRASSHWSELNKERCRRLEKLGLMTDAGRAAVDLDEEFVIPEDILEIIESDPVLKKNIESFPPLYVRIRISNIERDRKRKDVFEKALNNFIEKSRQGKIYGQWTDYGRLIDY